MSQHSKNTVKQSPLDQDMENEADQIANMVVSETSRSENISDTAEADRIQRFSESDSKNERQTGRGTSVLKRKRMFAYFFRKNKVQPILEQHEEEAAASGSRSTPNSSPPQVASTPTSVHSSEDMKTAVKAYLSPVPLVLVDVDDKDVSWKPSTIRSLPPITEEDLVMDRDSTPGPSGQGKHPQPSQEGSGVTVQLIGLKNTFYNIIKEFFNSLTEKQLEEIKRGVYNMDVKEQIIDMGMEVLWLAVEAITNTLSQAINQFAPQYGTVTSPTCSQKCSTEQVGQNLPSKLLRESFDITDDNIQKSVKSSFGKAFCDVISSDRTIEIPPQLTTVLVKTVTDELNYILSKSIQASLDGGYSSVSTVPCCLFSSCRKCKEMLMGVVATMKFWLTFQDIASNQRDSDPQTYNDRFEAASNSKDPKRNLLWWSCLMRWWKGKSRKASKEHVEQDVELPGDIRSLTPQATSTSCSDDNEDTMSEESRNAPSPYSTGYFPPADLKDKATVPDYQESPPVAETQYGDSSAEKSNRICQIPSKGKNKKEKMAASAQDDTLRTKKPSLLKRIQMFCCRLSCCCRCTLECN
eukprot:superscaffoldBa00000707_g6690